MTVRLLCCSSHNFLFYFCSGSKMFVHSRWMLDRVQGSRCSFSSSWSCWWVKVLVSTSSSLCAEFLSISRHGFASVMESVISISALRCNKQILDCSSVAHCTCIYCDRPGFSYKEVCRTPVGYCSSSGFKTSTSSEPQGNIRRSLLNMVLHSVESEILLFIFVVSPGLFYLLLRLVSSHWLRSAEDHPVCGSGSWGREQGKVLGFVWSFCTDEAVAL